MGIDVVEPSHLSQASAFLRVDLLQLAESETLAVSALGSIREWLN
jgi:hypothetical protein